MISKERFCKVLSLFKKQCDYDDKVYDITKEINSLGDGLYYKNEDLREAVLEALSENDDDKDWLSWFVYETNFGRDKTNQAYIDDLTFAITSPEAFYDFLKIYKKHKE